MAHKKISQAEARRLRNELKALKTRHSELLSSWGTGDHPGRHLFDMPLSDFGKGSVYAASQLNAVLVAKRGYNNDLRIFAVMP